MNKQISFIGYERGDLPYYLSKAIQKINKTDKILVIDNSKSGDVFDSLSKGNEEAYDKLITFVRNVTVNDSVRDTFDYVIIYHGENVQKELCEESDRNYVQLTYKPSDLRRISPWAKIVKEPVLIYRDKVNGKVKEEYLEKVNEITPFDRYILPIDQTDLSMYYGFLYNGKTVVRNESSELHELLVAMVMDTLGVTESVAKKYVKR